MHWILQTITKKDINKRMKSEKKRINRKAKQKIAKQTNKQTNKKERRSKMGLQFLNDQRYDFLN